MNDMRDRASGGRAWRTGVAHSHRTRDAGCGRRKGLAPVESRAERASVRSQCGGRARGRRAHETSIAATMIMRYIIVRGCGEGYAEGCRWRRGGAVAQLKSASVGSLQPLYVPVRCHYESASPSEIRSPSGTFCSSSYGVYFRSERFSPLLPWTLRYDLLCFQIHLS